MLYFAPFVFLDNEFNEDFQNFMLCLVRENTKENGKKFSCLFLLENMKENHM